MTQAIMNRASRREIEILKKCKKKQMYAIFYDFYTSIIFDSNFQSSPFLYTCWQIVFVHETKDVLTG